MHTRRARRKMRIGSILVIAGALVFLTPLFFWARDAWDFRVPSPVADRPVMLPPSTGELQTPPPPSPSVEDPSPGIEETAAAATIDQSQPGFGYRLQIPTLSLSVPIQRGIDDDDLHKGAGHYPQTPMPGEKGNAALAGHRTVKGKPSYFYSLDKLQAGDLIYVTYPDLEVQFAVERVFITHPYDLSVLGATDSPMLTLTTCDPPGTDENRLIVQARMVRATARN